MILPDVLFLINLILFFQIMNIYVGNLNYSLKEEELVELFSQFGEVVSVKLVSDKETGRAKGFGFVEMADDQDGAAAIEKLDGADVRGRNIKVNEAKPKTEGSGSSFRPRQGDRPQRPYQGGGDRFQRPQGDGRPQQRRDRY